jgi:hypothetical protein
MNLVLRFLIMAKGLLYILFLILSFNAFQLRADEIIKKNLSDFTQLIVQGRMAVILEEGKQYTAEIKIKSQDVDPEKIAFVSKGSQMIIKYTGLSLRELDMVIVLKVPNLDLIESRQGARISMASTMRIKSPKINVNVFAGGVITGKFDVDLADVNVDQGGDIVLVGTAKQLIANVTTGGSIDAVSFIANNGVVKVRMGGNITVNFRETLNASVFSGGVIKYRGSGTITEKITLGGSIEKL